MGVTIKVAYFVIGKLEKLELQRRFRSHLFTEILIFTMRALSTEIVKIYLIRYFNLLFFILSKTQMFVIILRVGKEITFFRII